MFEIHVVQVPLTTRTGAAQWFSETVEAFGLMSVILGGLRSRPESVLWLVGLFITAAYWYVPPSLSPIPPSLSRAR